MSSAQEERLLSRLDEVAPRDLAAGLRKALANPSTVVTVRDNPAAQSIIDSIVALRRQSLSATTGGASAASAIAGERMVNSSIAIALVDRLQDPQATAVILRRPNQLPHDVILLRRSDATAAELGAAMSSLAQVQARDGQVPTQNRMIVTRTRKVPARWQADGSDQAANRTLAALRAAPEEEITGLGRVRAVSITMGRRTK